MVDKKLAANSRDINTGELSDGGRPKQNTKLSRDRVQDSYDQHAVQLKRFLIGILRDEAAAADALQSTFTQLIEKGHSVQPKSLRSWLFRVAYNEALQLRRKQKLHAKAIDKVAWIVADKQIGTSSYLTAIQQEDIERVSNALSELPKEQRQIVVLRIHDNLRFQQISDQLGVPLGTVLSRMRTALRKLKIRLTEQI